MLNSQCIHISAHQVVHLKYIQFLFVSYTLVKLEKYNSAEVHRWGKIVTVGFTVGGPSSWREWRRVWAVQGFSNSLPLPLYPQEYPLAALAGTACHCGFPTTRFPLHEREDEQLCAQKCSAEEFESCGTPTYFIVYQTQVQGKPRLPQQIPRCFPNGLLSRGSLVSPLIQPVQCRASELGQA